MDYPTQTRPAGPEAPAIAKNLANDGLRNLVASAVALRWSLEREGWTPEGAERIASLYAERVINNMAVYVSVNL